MSKEQVELLDSLYRSSLNDEGKNVTAYDRSSLEAAMKDLSMFVVVTSAPTTAPTDDIGNVIAYPILYTDNSPETHIVYANGPNIQPLLDLSTLSEVWEFPLGGFSGHQNTNSAFVEPKNYTREIFSRVMTPSSLPIAERMNPGITRLSSDIELTLEGNVDATVRRFVNLLVRPVTDVRVKSIFRKAVVKTVATSRIRINNPRYIVKGDYVKGRAKEHRGVVDKIITEDEKIGSGGKKRTIIIEYRVEKFSALNKPTFVAIPVKDTVKLSDEEKMVPEILRHDDIFFGKRLPRRELDAQATKRRSLQWANSNTLRKENVKFCGITFANMKRYVKYCKERYPCLWSQCIRKRGKNKFVSIDDLCQDFIRPQTKDVNSCIALNMKSVLGKDFEIPAEVFVSLSWEEDIEKVIDMLELQKGTNIGKNGSVFSDKTVIWMSAFSIYQGDGRGSLSNQLDIGVFQQITKSVLDMFVIQTGTCNSYSRLWCVSEFSAAIENNVKIHHIFSKDWEEKYIRSNNTGFTYGWEIFEHSGGKKVKIYRKKLSNENGDEKVRLAGKIPDFFKSVNYFLMEEDEWGDGPGGPQPILRLNVQGGLRRGSGKIRAADLIEFQRIDSSKGGKHEFWWRLQKTIVEYEKKAAGATDYLPYYTVMHDFAKTYEPKWGTNTDIIRRVQIDDGGKIARKVEELLDGFVPKILPGLDQQGRLFLEFQTDEQAATYFTQVLGLKPKYDPKNFKNLLSFGSGGKNNEFLRGDDKVNFNFPNIERLAKLLDSAYVDSLNLPPLAASYKLVPAKGEVANPRNIFWAEYYQKVMKKAKTMTFIITAAWLGSKNCWEELGWAADCRQDAKQFTTIFVFTDVAYYNQLEKQQTFTFGFGSEARSYNWVDLKIKLGFTYPAICARTVKEVLKEVNKRRLREGGQILKPR